MGMNFVPLIAGLFLHAYEKCFLLGIVKNKGRKLAQTFNSSFCYIDDVLSRNNFLFGDFLHLSYPNKLMMILPIIKILLPILTFTLKSTVEED